MKGGKDEDKQMDPLFPRLHISDAEKGGPRAPPRNKMALFEQLTIPSQSGSASMLPLLPINNGSAVPSTSSSHGGCHKQTALSPLCNSPRPMDKRFKAFSTLPNIEWKPINHQTLSAPPHLRMAKRSLSQQHSFSNSKNSSIKKLGDEVDVGVPTFPQSGKTPICGNGQQDMDKEKLASSSPDSFGKLQFACEKQLKRTGTTDLKSRQDLRNQTDVNMKVSPISQNHAERASILSTRDKILMDASSNPLARGRISEPCNQELVSLNQKKRNSLVDDLRATRKQNASTIEGISCSIPTIGDNKSTNRLEVFSKFHEDQDCGPLREDLHRNDHISDTSVDSISGMDISSNDIVGLIGQKQFWEARRSIIHQQRVFAVQVFELHRLIKVQRLIAGSPELLFEDNFYFDKLSSTKKLPSENNVLESTPTIVKTKVDSQKLNPSTECASENAVKRLPPPPVNDYTDKGHLTRQSPVFPPTANEPTPWCFHPPPGNQWLVPIRSPSEGLVYKPYTGPCPPTAAFMAPVYDSCVPMSLTPVTGDFLNSAYGVSAFHHQGTGIPSGPSPFGQAYFPPYGLPVTNPSGSSSAVEQVSPVARAQSNGHENHLPVHDIRFTIPYQKGGMMPECVRNFQVSKESDLQGSTASSPSENALPLFPTAPAAQVSDQPSEKRGAEQQIQVIKVVPHNPKSASESAARIFRSIQEERYHLKAK